DAAMDRRDDGDDGDGRRIRTRRAKPQPCWHEPAGEGANGRARDDVARPMTIGDDAKRADGRRGGERADAREDVPRWSIERQPQVLGTHERGGGERVRGVTGPKRRVAI